MNYQQIIFEIKDDVAWITLNRPEKLNALTQIMLKEWKHVLLSILKNDTCRAVVVTGAGRAFSAGVDLSVFQEIKVEPGYQMYDDGIEIMNLLETMPQVSIAMVNGACFTGAMEIMMAFDLIIAADEAKIGDTHTKWGIPPKWGMTQRLQNQIGIRKAKELSFTARPISGIEAAELGLANKSVPLAELENKVQELLSSIKNNSAQTIAAVKTMYHFGNMHSLEEGLKYEKEYEAQFSDKIEDLKNFKKNI